MYIFLSDDYNENKRRGIIGRLLCVWTLEGKQKKKRKGKRTLTRLSFDLLKPCLLAWLDCSTLNASVEISTILIFK
jgi:hypothetical protein